MFSGSNGYTTDSEKVYDIGSVAWYDVDYEWGSTHDIKTKQPNELGLYDMSGNVEEWCWDWYGSYDSIAQVNPTGLSSGRSRVYRGGSWNDLWFECRVANRYYSGPHYAFMDLGFRVVRTYVESLESQDQSQSSSDNSASTTSEAKNDFILVEGGLFKMGSNSGGKGEKPEHSVIVSDFYMSDHEVTQAEYRAVMGTVPSSFFNGDNKPVEKVSWYDAVEYCNKLSEMKGLMPCYIIKGANVSCDFTANGYRLPTEAELSEELWD